MAMSKHENNGDCAGCDAIISKFPNFHLALRAWFKERQKATPEFHCADAGRGKVDQERYFSRGLSRAHWGESAHNYNCGLDTFFLVGGQYRLDEAFYDNLVQNLPQYIEWLGEKNSPFYERPHFQRRAWRDAVHEGFVKLVE